MINAHQFHVLDQQLFWQAPQLHSRTLTLEDNTRPRTLTFARLDLLHPLISGNKWPKIRGWLLEFKGNRIESMGGAYSNHLLALCAAANALDLDCTCYIRANGLGDELIPTPVTERLEQLGAQLLPVNRTVFRQLRQVQRHNFCPEGGSGKAGVCSVAQWARHHQDWLLGFDQIFVACGTGTWMAGLLAGLNSTVAVIGSPAVKGESWLADQINRLQSFVQQPVHHGRKQSWVLDWSYPQRGFSPVVTEEQRALQYWLDIPMDQVYLPRVMHTVKQCWHQGRLAENPLIIHSGGIFSHEK